MNGIGKSLRERADMSYLDCCIETAKNVCVVWWEERQAFKWMVEGAGTFCMLVIFTALAPISIPLCAAFNMRDNKRRFKFELARQEALKERLQSRVQKQKGDIK